MDANQVPPRHHRGLLAGAVLLSAAAVTLPILQRDDQAAVPPVAAIASHQAAPAGTGTGASVPAQAPPPPGAVDDQAESSLASRLVGRWTMEKHGSRTLHLKSDGSATVEARLNLLASLVYGERLKLDLTWTLEGDVMSQAISGGTPEAAVQRLTRDWGDRREYRVIEVDEEHLVLSEVGDDGDRDVWMRVQTQETTAGTAGKEQSPR